MNRLFRKALLTSLLMGLISIHSMVRADAPIPTQTIGDLKGQYLFVQNAQFSVIEPIKNQTGLYTIIFKNVSPNIIYISDRPNRKTGQLAIEEFIKLWQLKGPDSFKENPPNAVLSSVQSSLFSSDKNTNLAFELSNPLYDAKAKTLSYTAKALEGTPSIETIQTLEHVSLFIDDACLSCW